jgi:hypothetical protein
MPSDRSCRPGEDEERGLKRILGLVMIAQDRMTDPLDHGPVPLYERRERQFVTPRYEHLQQLPVTHSGDRPGFEEETEVASHRGVIKIAHGWIPLHPTFPRIVR